MEDSEEYMLKWNSHNSEIISEFHQLAKVRTQLFLLYQGSTEGWSIWPKPKLYSLWLPKLNVKHLLKVARNTIELITKLVGLRKE